ncbi:MAG: integration host factor subunit beta [Deltaproteobacteria bacterium]|nr:integration host factor subunit beta [Deltaproteobacteria bacterium]
MTKSELIDLISVKMPDLSKKDVAIAVNTVFDSMTEALVKQDRIEIRGFGSFRVKHRKSRDGRNPKTGEPVKVPNKRIPFFTVGKELRDKLNHGKLNGA